MNNDGKIYTDVKGILSTKGKEDDELECCSLRLKKGTSGGAYLVCHMIIDPLIPVSQKQYDWLTESQGFEEIDCDVVLRKELTEKQRELLLTYSTKNPAFFDMKKKNNTNTEWIFMSL